VFRLLGVFAAGRIMNAKTGRSQLFGGVTWGLSMALHEHSALDPRFGQPTQSIPVRPIGTLENAHQRP
jgi:CO/xanthine dehydrogenase Mo-binding subunit